MAIEWGLPIKVYVSVAVISTCLLMYVGVVFAANGIKLNALAVIVGQHSFVEELKQSTSESQKFLLSTVNSGKSIDMKNLNITNFGVARKLVLVEPKKLTIYPRLWCLP